MDIAMIASFIRWIIGISSSVSGRFRGAGKWFRQAIFGKNLRVIGLSVGSRRMFGKMASAIERNDMKPVITGVAFDAVPEGHTEDECLFIGAGSTGQRNTLIFGKDGV
jgi:hypothetical protein